MPAHVQLVCNICRWQSHRKSANIDHEQGECIYILAIFWNCKTVFRFWTFQRVLKSLCGHNLNYGKTKQYAIWQLELQNWTAKRNFQKSKRKKWKKKKKKKQRFGRERFTLVGMEAITWRKTRNYKEKTKSIFDREKWKKKRAGGVGEIRFATSELLLRFV